MSKNISWDNIPQVDIQKVNQTISDDYDKLNAKNAVKAIRDLGLPELLIVWIHEFNTKRRKTVMPPILKKIVDALQALALMDEYQRAAQEGFTILLVGQTGVGKSATINSLFGEEVAKTNKFTAETKSVTPFQGIYHDVKYTIYDTPGLGEKDSRDENLDEIYLSLMKEQCPLPDVLWYVLKLDDHRVTAADENDLKLIREYFGEEIWGRTMIVFTHSDMLKTTEDFQESLVNRTQTVNEVIAQITDGIVQGVPAVAVANEHEDTPDGKSWLGELFTTTYERLNPEHQIAFLLAFGLSFQLPESQSTEPYTQISTVDTNTEIMGVSGEHEQRIKEKRIKLTEEQVERVREKSVGVSDVLSGAILGAEIGVIFDAAMGGTTMGIPTIMGAILGSIAAYISGNG